MLGPVSPPLSRLTIPPDVSPRRGTRKYTYAKATDVRRTFQNECEETSSLRTKNAKKFALYYFDLLFGYILNCFIDNSVAKSGLDVI